MAAGRYRRTGARAPEPVDRFVGPIAHLEVPRGVLSGAGLGNQRPGIVTPTAKGATQIHAAGRTLSTHISIRDIRSNDEQRMRAWLSARRD